MTNFERITIDPGQMDGVPCIPAVGVSSLIDNALPPLLADKLTAAFDDFTFPRNNVAVRRTSSSGSACAVFNASSSRDSSTSASAFNASTRTRLEILLSATSSDKTGAAPVMINLLEA